ncbi:two-component system response regulator [candidate division WOR-1 bacterium RIFOXYB2_FULL_48_7]|uniref:Two-component system response regulator n=1 Tax=candidate division WOR-1 bacterium RIFOXYB2_FULL_48_7 TaxID=1802583 RepID=A0A1F4T848_UNCSA|nr:MAG: two-component system response regulator [candidate division WOR-1 bacterium RIFOXYB2_FULL_48_7]
MDQNLMEVLLVEDNLSDVELTLRALKKNNLANNVFVVHDGAEALDYINQTGKYKDKPNKRPKVILLDLKLPKLSGVEVLRALKAGETTKTIPVVVLTSSKEEPDIKECYKLGVNSYIVKPLDFETFVRVVSDLGLYWLLINKVPADNQ